jgi:hypothetical protein
MEQPARIAHGKRSFAARSAARTDLEFIGGMLVRRKWCCQAQLRFLH